MTTPMTTLLSKPETLKKLIALAPISEREAFLICGWSAQDFQDTFRGLIEDRTITFTTGNVRQQRMYRIRQ